MDVVESRHHGHLVVVDPDGGEHALGDPTRLTFTRSAAKPFQATGCYEVLEETGGVPALSAEATAVTWASHRGEPRHLSAVREVLAAAETDEQDLTCPPDVSADEPGGPRERIRHNCSGKHALFALAGRRLGLSGEDLIDPQGPLQQRLLGVWQEAAGTVHAVAVDGCGAPTAATPLVGLARGYRDVATGGRWARVRDAGLAAGGLVGGNGRLESALLDAGVVAKVGAEGVYGIGWVDADGGAWGLAAKSEDGQTRGAGAPSLSVLAAIGAVPADLWSEPPPLGGGRPAGAVRTAAGVLEWAATLVR